MKAIYSLLCLLIATVASAETQVMKDPGSAALAKMLKGYSLMCAPIHKGEYEKGFYPLKVSAKDLGSGKTLLSVITKDPELGFGNGGDRFDDVEVTANWTIISCGDDGRNILQFSNFDVEDAVGSDNGWVCDPEQLKKGETDGQIPGVMTGLWDAGHVDPVGVQCCIL